MTKFVCGGSLTVLVSVLCLCMTGMAGADKDDEGPKVVENVYFSLKDKSIEAKKKMIDSCKGYLSQQPGIVFFAAGTLADDFKLPFRDRNFDVSLHIVFKNKAARAKFPDSEGRKKFVEANKENWMKVRAFDSEAD
jgi:hypothetical protein